MTLLAYGILIYTVGKIVDWLTLLGAGGVLAIPDKLVLTLSIIYVVMFIIKGGI